MAEGELQATFHQLGLQSADPARLKSFYERTFGYRFQDCGDTFRGVANGRRMQISNGAPKALDYAAYAVPGQADLGRLEARLRKADVAFERSPRAGFQGEALVFRDPDGNRFEFGVADEGSPAFEAPLSSRPARLQHIVFASTDLDRMVRFFTDVVGFTLSDLVLDEEGGVRTAFVRCSHEHHSLAVFSAGERRLDHHCYEAAEWNLIRDWADHFAKEKIPLKWGPGRHGPGNNLFLFIHDPDGNWVEISAELETVAAERPVGRWPHEEATLNTWGMGLLRS